MDRHLFASVNGERDKCSQISPNKGTAHRNTVAGFCNFSEKAYGACLYLRSVNQQEEVTTKLLSSKSRVATVKKITLPRLELCGGLLLAQFVQKTVPALNLKFARICYEQIPRLCFHG